MTKSNNFYFFLSWHPLFFVAPFLMLGISAQAEGYVLICCIAFISSSICLQLLNKLPFKPLHLCLMAGSFLLGVARLHQIQEQTNAARRRLPSTMIALDATVHDIISINNNRYKHQFILKDIMLTTSNTSPSISLPGMLAVYTNTTKNLQVDDSIKLDSIQFKQTSNQGFQQYLTKQKILAAGFSDPMTTITLVKRPNFSFWRYIASKKKSVYSNLKKKMSAKTFSFFSPLFLGFKQKTSYEKRIKDQFAWWGLSHYLARSGLHLVLFMLIWRMFLRLFPISFMIKILLPAILTLVYYIFTWSSISFDRALLTLLLYTILIVTRQQVHSLHTLVVVTIMVLLYNPLHLFFLDFQLSFGMTYMLLLFNEIKRKRTAYAPN